MLVLKPHSSAIDTMTFDKDTKELTIIFRGTPNTAYVYSNVSRQRLTAAMHSNSLGSYFQVIRSQPELFPFRKVTIG